MTEEDKVQLAALNKRVFEGEELSGQLKELHDHLRAILPAKGTAREGISRAEAKLIAQEVVEEILKKQQEENDDIFRGGLHVGILWSFGQGVLLNLSYIFWLDSSSHSKLSTTSNGAHSSSILCSEPQSKKLISSSREVEGSSLQSGASISFTEAPPRCSRVSINTSPSQCVEGPQSWYYQHTQSTSNELKRRHKSSS
eukprot:gene25824-33730_t